MTTLVFKIPNLQQLVGEITWGQNIMIMQRIKDEAAGQYYLEGTARLSWTHADGISMGGRLNSYDI